MKTKMIYLIIVFANLCLCANAQNYEATLWDEYEGLWEYAHNDTVFRIKLKRGVTEYSDNETSKAIYGNYSLKVNGIMKEDYMGVLPSTVRFSDLYSYPRAKVYIYDDFLDSYAYITPKTGIGFRFFDQRKKHAEGKGLVGGQIKLLSPNTLHWTLNEEVGLWEEYEGDADRVMPDPIGFSVPTDVIMTRVIEDSDSK
ncbi:MAG: hypothetical protein LBM62_10475 [Mediterranea sp.]|jgi:hypothetical protein|nr:hypothetical protein [Mediterranea sp.]